MFCHDCVVGLVWASTVVAVEIVGSDNHCRPPSTFFQRPYSQCGGTILLLESFLAFVADEGFTQCAFQKGEWREVDIVDTSGVVESVIDEILLDNADASIKCTGLIHVR